MEWAMSTFSSHKVYIANFEVDTANSDAKVPMSNTETFVAGAS
jgi:hypothetical protein